jgi:DNA-binding NarL/FixJ family response regulator
VLIVDNHPLVRDGLASHINRQPDLTVCGEVDDPADALKQIADRRPDVVILGLVFKTGSGLEIVGDIVSRYPRLPTIVFSSQNEHLYAPRALRKGAKGFVGKGEPGKTVIEAIRHVLSGHVYLSQTMRAEFLDAIPKDAAPNPSPLDALSDRELEVFHLLGEGLPSSQIAARLHLSCHTVQTYYDRIKLRLSLTNHSDLCRHAVLWVHAGDDFPR